jgi:hypothetical protein
MNEEEVKARVLLPYLSRVGLAVDELSLATPFRIRLARKTVSSPSMVSGRSNLLVRRGDENLFVVEVKRPEVPLTDDDRDQGISYARATFSYAGGAR